MDQQSNFNGRFVFRLTRSQQMALVDLVAHYMRSPDAIEEFVDCVNDVTTTPGELLSLLLSTKEIENEPCPR